jgi:hypothetical protein
MRYDSIDELPVNQLGKHFLPCCGMHIAENAKMPIRCGCDPNGNFMSKEQIEEIQKLQEDKEVMEQAIAHLENEGVSLENAEQMEGLGDLLEKTFSTFGITEDRIKRLTGLKECGCTKRKKWLNKVFPFGKKK